MRNFDPTPDGVTLFRLNAIGFTFSIFAMFGAMYWWMGMSTPLVHESGWFATFFLVLAAFTAGMYALPALVPRRPWGYIVAWIQLAFSLTSVTATLPSLVVLMTFAKDEVKQWFDGKPIGFVAPSASRPAIVTAIVGWYTLASLAPFGLAYLMKPSIGSPEVAAAVAGADSHVMADRSGVVEERALESTREVTAYRLTTNEPWRLSEQHQPVAVTVWASYCGACTSQFRAIAENGGQLSPAIKHVTLALDCRTDDGDNAAAVRSELAASRIRSEALCATAATEIEVNSLPTTIYFDAQGRQRATLRGYQTFATLRAVANAVESR